jgi:ribosomal protein S18 acetylase RimI-like enzyme
MTVRRATEADESTLREFWAEFEAEVPFPFAEERETWEEEWRDTVADLNGGGVFIAEDDEGPVGTARIEAPEQGHAHIHLAIVRPRARRQGVLTALLRECVQDARDRGAARVTLDVLADNTAAREVWRRLGFEELQLRMVAPVDALEVRLVEKPVGVSHATTHVQTDDGLSVERAIQHFVPRLEAPVVSSNGSWIRVVDPALDPDREAHGRFAKELSERLGAVSVALALEHSTVVRFQLYERGRMVDEYLSVPTFYGPLPKVDELALAANPTLVARLTGADHDDVKRVARTAATPAELPPAPELYEQIAKLMGLEP